MLDECIVIETGDKKRLRFCRNILGIRYEENTNTPFRSETKYARSGHQDLIK